MIPEFLGCPDRASERQNILAGKMVEHIPGRAADQLQAAPGEEFPIWESRATASAT
jgi:hypothetical protein